jgi:hypothetical protein
LLIAALSLDPVGNVSFVIQIIVLFLLILGLPLSKGSTNQKNLIRHGYSTLAALILHTVAILIVMIPSLVGGVNGFADMSLVASVTVWSHVVLGTLAWILGIIIIAFWLGKGPFKMTCAIWRKWMMPVFIIWVISIFNGALVHIFSLI